jgi:SNF family Na+-dependent transporter
MIRILTLNTPDPNFPSRNISNALGFLWNPSFTYLFKAKVWLAAAGQIFFTLSVGIGVIITYASYLKKNDDIVLSGLSAVSTNEFAEVILGSSIIIPAAYIFFGQEQILQITQSGTFNLSFITMPKIFSQIPFGTFFAFIWFLLLFIAGITSSISLLQPSIAFFEDEFNVSRKKAVTIIITTCFILCHIPIFFISKGVIGELDFWGGTFCLVIFATVEIFLFSWIFGIDKAWEEMHNGAEIKIPKIYKFIIKYITPTFLVTILIGWLIQEGFNVIIMKDIPLENKPYVLGTRILLLAIFTTLGLLVRHAWKKRYAGVKQ